MVTRSEARDDSKVSAVHYPIEGVYSAIEVKQSLGYSELDEGMEKLVKVSRLNRPTVPYGHITENQHLRCLDKEGYRLNPLQRPWCNANKIP